MEHFDDKHISSSKFINFLWEDSELIALNMISMNLFVLKSAYPEMAGQTLFLGSKHDDDQSDSDMEDIDRKRVKGCELLIPTKTKNKIYSIKIDDSDPTSTSNKKSDRN